MIKPTENKGDENKNINLIEELQNNPEKIKAFNTTVNRNDETIKCQSIINNLAKRLALTHNVSQHQALIGIACIFQAGGYLKNVDNRKIKVLETEFDKKTILLILDQLKNTYTLRQLARSMNKLIAITALTNNVPGHLYAQFKLENPSFNPTLEPDKAKLYSAYCTDFQLENPDIPPIVKQFLADRAKNRRNNKK